MSSEILGGLFIILLVVSAIFVLFTDTFPPVNPS